MVLWLHVVPGALPAPAMAFSTDCDNLMVLFLGAFNRKKRLLRCVYLHASSLTSSDILQVVLSFFEPRMKEARVSHR